MFQYVEERDAHLRPSLQLRDAERARDFCLTRHSDLYLSVRATDANSSDKTLSGFVQLRLEPRQGFAQPRFPFTQAARTDTTRGGERGR